MTNLCQGGPEYWTNCCGEPPSCPEDEWGDHDWLDEMDTGYDECIRCGLVTEWHAAICVEFREL